ncbi:C9orf72-like protein family-domain-containing protein [Umbelopsis sp. AD052]|nr:C9orf72-like protein family-domain-containing protein [Umbelopsis sp. AD052]
MSERKRPVLAPQKSKATSTAVNTLEVTTKAVVTAAIDEPDLQDNVTAPVIDSPPRQRKHRRAHHQHHHMHEQRSLSDVGDDTADGLRSRGSPTEGSTLDSLMRWWKEDNGENATSSEPAFSKMHKSRVPTSVSTTPFSDDDNFHPSEAMAALKDAASESAMDSSAAPASHKHARNRTSNGRSRKKPHPFPTRRMHSYLESISGLQGHAFDPTSPSPQQGSFSPATFETTQELNLPDSSFFSAVMLIKWSNVMGPEVEKVWASDDQAVQTKKATYTGIAKQVLNGEIGRTILEIEPKFLVLGDEGVICTSFLFAEYNNPSSKNGPIGGTPTTKASKKYSLDTNKISALVFLVPLQYLRNFSNYFDVMVDRVPGLVEKLRRLRLITKTPWTMLLNHFTSFHLIPFVHGIMDLESVSLPKDCLKISHTILGIESRRMFDNEFVARLITSHLQTHGSTLVVGTNITTMNMVINTLALFLFPEERDRSSHTRKEHQYMPDLYAQGVLAQVVDQMDANLDFLVLESPEPTTLVDLSRLTIEQTAVLPEYSRVRTEFYRLEEAHLEESALHAETNAWRLPALEDESLEWTRQIFHTAKGIAPCVASMLKEIDRMPLTMREAFVRQWRRGLLRKALAVIKFLEDQV